ncbi:MAG: UMP kinase [Methanothrix sp.]|jgi:uridylate kinase|uniref:Uridylate kinase n=1 Tax=Methanothrix harundinacea TaxID=301375 RepID=A0A101FV50_9EURY|nr:MAG: uridylate kinase [Methanosaeta sp. SDB]KUK44897.1 MAG: Uridylate kinase [Methanothrix harundinacea]MDD2637861.1 UMP kinase [Methanothrix sp.]MDI9398730.1 UMP kinase [Euryarchaeota archaeon]KUK97255.1 MAG: Uridylate kinase [Methanothrix harundinacea]
MILVYSLGGSILYERSADELKNFARSLVDLAEYHQVYVVVGGGKIAREYIGKARALEAGEAFCDLLGIGATKLNAMLLIAALGKAAAPEPPETYARALAASAGGKIVVLGGMQPGQTTDAVAALLAEYVHADKLIVATSVDGVYSADPGIDPKAKKFDTMTHQDLVRLSMETEMKAGSRSPVDPLAAKIVERSSIPTAVVYGGDVENLKRAAEGSHSGTEIS